MRAPQLVVDNRRDRRSAAFVPGPPGVRDRPGPGGHAKAAAGDRPRDRCHWRRPDTRNGALRRAPGRQCRFIDRPRAALALRLRRVDSRMAPAGSRSGSGLGFKGLCIAHSPPSRPQAGRGSPHGDHLGSPHPARLVFEPTLLASRAGAGSHLGRLDGLCPAIRLKRMAVCVAGLSHGPPQVTLPRASGVGPARSLCCARRLAGPGCPQVRGNRKMRIISLEVTGRLQNTTVSTVSAQ
jgi:hypothetical protein